MTSDSQARQAIAAEGLKSHIVKALVDPAHDGTAFAKTANGQAAFAKTSSGEPASAKTDGSPRGHWTSASRAPLPTVKPSSRSTALPPAQLIPAQQEAVQRMTEVLVRRQYAYNMGSANPPDITKADIEQHLLVRVRDEGIAESAQNGVINAIKFYYEKVLDRDRTFYDIARPIRREVLPKVLAREEVREMLARTYTNKHSCMLMLLYGGGLRLSEVLELLPADIDSKRMTVSIRCSRGKQDRIVPLPRRLLAPLREYYRQYQPITWLFEGETPGERYSPRSLQKVVKQAAKRAGIARPVSAHMLRHSFATARQRGPLTPLPRHGGRHEHPVHPGGPRSQLNHDHGAVPTRVTGVQADLAVGHPGRVVADISLRR